MQSTPTNVAPVGVTMVDLRTPLVLASSESQRVGFLRKRGQFGLAAKWKKRWFVLKNTKFWYYGGNQKDLDKPKGCIDLMGATIRVSAVDTRLAVYLLVENHPETSRVAFMGNNA
jgi:hypothetical protein